MTVPVPSPAPAAPPVRRLVPWVCLGGVAGAATSLGLSAALRGSLGGSLGPAPWGRPVTTAALASLPTAAVLNVAGAFLLGLLRGRGTRAAAAGRPWDARITPTLGTGLLGSFTSFSALTAPLGALAAQAGGRDDAAAGLAVALALVVLMAALGTLAAVAGLVVGRGGAGTAAADGTSKPGTGKWTARREGRPAEAPEGRP